MSIKDKTFAEAGEFLKQMAKGKGPLLDSNRSIINVADKFFGVPQAVYKMGTGEGFQKALSSTFKRADGSLDIPKIAGSYIGVAAGARVLSGGGIYKDNKGQANLIGVPFV